MVAGLAVGAVVGAINGSLVAYARIPSFLVTLAMLGIAAGVAQWVTDSAPQPILADVYNTIFGSGNLGLLPGLVLWMAVAVVIGADRAEADPVRPAGPGDRRQPDCR